MPLHPDYLRIIPDLHTPEYDQQDRRDTHFALFGHYPPITPGEKCRHPIHDTIRRNMNGAAFDIDFNDTEIVSDDSAYHANLEDRRKVIFRAVEDLQDDLEEREKYDNARKLGLILP